MTSLITENYALERDNVLTTSFAIAKFASTVVTVSYMQLLLLPSRGPRVREAIVKMSDTRIETHESSKFLRVYKDTKSPLFR